MVLFTLDTVFFHERQREPQAGEGSGRLARALRCSGEQDGGLGPARDVGRPPGSQEACREGSKNTAAGSVRLVLTYFVPEPPSLQRRLGGGERALTCFVQKVKTTAGGLVGVRRALICFVPEPPVRILLIILFVIFHVNYIAHDSLSKQITHNSVYNLSIYKSLPLTPKAVLSHNDAGRFYSST